MRFTAIDVFRGISILYMIIGHTSEFWLYNSELWFRGIIFIIMDVIGANAFIMLSGIGLSLSYHSQMRKIASNSQYPRGYAKINFWSRTILIGLIAVVTNLIGTLALESPTGWIWLVLQTIAWGRLFCYPFMKFNWKVRAIIGIGFFLTADLVRSALLGYNDFLFYVFFNVNGQNTPFPFFGFIFLGSALGDWFNSKMNQTNQTNQTQQRNQTLSRNTNIQQSRQKQQQYGLNYFVYIGIICISIGICFGLSLSSAGDWGLWVNQINLHPNLEITGLPLFLCRNSIPWCFYSFGIEILFLSFLLYIDGRRSKKPSKELIIRQDPRMVTYNESKRNKKTVTVTINNKSHTMTLYPEEKVIILRKTLPCIVKDNNDRGILLFGKRSMTLYLIHFMLYATIAVRNSLSVFPFLLAYMGFVLLLYYLMRMWLTYGREIMTFEWLMQRITNVCEDIYNKRRLKNNELSSLEKQVGK